MHVTPLHCSQSAVEGLRSHIFLNILLMLGKNVGDLVQHHAGTGDACNDAPLQDTEVVEEFIVCIGKGRKITHHLSNWADTCTL